MEKEYEFNPGDVIQHKATSKKCVVIEPDKNMIIVRDSDNSIQIYYEHELVLLLQNQDLSDLNTR